MKKRVLKKENLDRVAANLLKAARMTDAEIENIVNKPQLFDSIAATIKTGEKDRREPDIKEHRSFLNFNFRVFGAAVSAIVLIVAAIVFYNRAQNYSENRIAQNDPVITLQTAAVSDEKTLLPTAETKQFIKTAAQTTKNVRPNSDSKRPDKRPRKTFVRKSAPISDTPPAEDVYAAEGKFYALPFAGESIGDITQIVRAELSRAELSALGIDLPLDENDDDRILTDLIYGSNGEPKAFRLIGKL